MSHKPSHKKFQVANVRSISKLKLIGIQDLKVTKVGVCVDAPIFFRIVSMQETAKLFTANSQITKTGLKV